MVTSVEPILCLRPGVRRPRTGLRTTTRLLRSFGLRGTAVGVGAEDAVAVAAAGDLDADVAAASKALLLMGTASITKAGGRVSSHLLAGVKGGSRSAARVAALPAVGGEAVRVTPAVCSPSLSPMGGAKTRATTTAVAEACGGGEISLWVAVWTCCGGGEVTVLVAVALNLGAVASATNSARDTTPLTACAMLEGMRRSWYSTSV